MDGGGNYISNAGLIATSINNNVIRIETQNGAHAGETTRIFNSGTISGQGASDGNPGEVITVHGSSPVEITNSGVIYSSANHAIGISDGTTTLNNSGLIHGEVFLNHRGSFLTNNLGGTIEATSIPAIGIAGGDNHVSNAGTITSSGPTATMIFYGLTGVQAGDVNSLVNSGTISGQTTTAAPTVLVYQQGNAKLDITNNGTLHESNGYAIYNEGTGDATLINNGTIHGNIYFAGGHNVIDMRHGTLEGTLNCGGASINTIHGTTGDDTIITNSGSDYIDGFGGADHMTGGAGGDTYVVDDAGDVVDESSGSGLDTILSSISFDLSDTSAVLGKVETLRLLGSAALDASGSAKNETITGNVAANVLSGEGGNDTLNGRAGSDTLIGGEGKDILKGGGGRDLMQGGNGNDTYFVDRATDVVDETNGSGSDLVNSSVSFSLANKAQALGNIEKLTLTGANAINGTGNSLANTITGNGAANSIDGGLGNDSLRGNGGADSFVFDKTLNSTTNVDTIVDFAAGTDHIVLENAIFTKFAAAGHLAAGHFALNASADANDYIIYHTADGTLWYDADGNGGGAAIKFAILSGVPGLTATDFIII